MDRESVQVATVLQVVQGLGECVGVWGFIGRSNTIRIYLYTCVYYCRDIGVVTGVL